MEDELIDPRRLLVDIVRILDERKIPYAVTGGIAVFVWARPRFTADIDIVISLRPESVEMLADDLAALGEWGYIDQEDMRRALNRHGEFNFIDGRSGVKVDFWIVGNTAFDAARFKRKIKKKVLGRTVFFVSPEDLILSKLLWYRDSGSELQLRDVESVLKFQKKLDCRYLRIWAEKQQTFLILKPLLMQYGHSAS